MARIYLPPKKESTYKRNYKTESKRENLNFMAVYNTNHWRGLRVEYLRAHPLCEICQEKGIVSSAREVHHKIPISSGNGIIEKQRLGFDWKNLQTLCVQCHKDQHIKTSDNDYDRKNNL